MKQCTSCRRYAAFKISFSSIIQYYCEPHWQEAKVILDAANVPYTIEEIEVPPPKPTIHDRLAAYHEEHKNDPKPIPLTKEQKELEEQRRIIRGIRKHQNQTNTQEPL